MQFGGVQHRQRWIIFKEKIFHIAGRHGIFEAVRYRILRTNLDNVVHLWQGGAAIDGIDTFRQTARADSDGCAAVVLFLQIATRRRIVLRVEQLSADEYVIRERVSLVHAGITGRVIIGEMLLNDGAKFNDACCAAIAIRSGGVGRIAAVCKSTCRLRASANQTSLRVAAAKNQFGRNIKINGGLSIIHCRVVGVTFRTRTVGVVTHHLRIAPTERRGCKRKSVAVDLKCGRKCTQQMLPVRKRIGDDQIAKRKEIRDLKRKRIFQLIA